MKPLFFKTPDAFREWLDKNHSLKTEVWIGFWKKASGKTGMNYHEALDEALCYGWIDGIVNKYDELAYAQRFTPRRPKSVWSKVNTENIERLTRMGKMMPSGMAAVEAAKADGRWETAYESPANAKVPDDFLLEVKKNKKAYEFFRTLGKANTFTIFYQLQSAKKDETRKKRMEKILQMLEKGEKFH
jgi:uncharacterized protein YdeI (YjbR/CyaY-like superfamily)